MVRTIDVTLADIQRCPDHSLLAGHYRQDGSCYCTPRRPTNADRLQRIREMREHGATMDEIGHRFGISRQRVQQLLSRG